MTVNREIAHEGDYWKYPIIRSYTLDNGKLIHILGAKRELGVGYSLGCYKLIGFKDGG